MSQQIVGYTDPSRWFKSGKKTVEEFSGTLKHVSGSKNGQPVVPIDFAGWEDFWDDPRL